MDGSLTLGAAQGSTPAPLPARLSLGTGRTPSGLETTDLRITLPDAPQGGTSRFVVGAWSEDANSFQEIMTVEANGDVSLFGNLTKLPANTAPGKPKTQPGFDEDSRSEEGRVGEECVSTWRSWWWPAHKKKKHKKPNNQQ